MKEKKPPYLLWKRICLTNKDFIEIVEFKKFIWSRKIDKFSGVFRYMKTKKI